MGKIIDKDLEFSSFQFRVCHLAPVFGRWRGPMFDHTNDLFLVDTEYFPGRIEGAQGRFLWIECFSQTSHGQGHGQGPYQKTKIDGPNTDEDFDSFCDQFTKAATEEPFKVLVTDHPETLLEDVGSLIGEFKQVLGLWFEEQISQKAKWVIGDVRAASKAIATFGVAMQKRLME